MSSHGQKLLVSDYAAAAAASSGGASSVLGPESRMPAVSLRLLQGRPHRWNPLCLISILWNNTPTCNVIRHCNSKVHPCRKKELLKHWWGKKIPHLRPGPCLLLLVIPAEKSEDVSRCAESEHLRIHAEVWRWSSVCWNKHACVMRGCSSCVYVMQTSLPPSLLLTPSSPLRSSGQKSIDVSKNRHLKGKRPPTWPSPRTHSAFIWLKLQP